MYITNPVDPYHDFLRDNTSYEGLDEMLRDCQDLEEMTPTQKFYEDKLTQIFKTEYSEPKHVERDEYYVKKQNKLNEELGYL